CVDGWRSTKLPGLGYQPEPKSTEERAYHVDKGRGSSSRRVHRNTALTMTGPKDNEASSSSAKPAQAAMKKLAPIPNGAKVQKRPLTRRQLPSSSKAPIIYISSSTPFMSAVKRAQKLLDKSLRNATAAAPKNASLHSRVQALQRSTGEDNSDGTTVTVTGTGKAVEKTLGVAGWFEQRGDCVVRVRTGTVGTVDDVVGEGEGEDESRVVLYDHKPWEVMRYEFMIQGVFEGIPSSRNHQLQRQLRDVRRGNVTISPVLPCSTGLESGTQKTHRLASHCTP
ncbi:hypothetical protein TOPH_07546, partial [Tolypocladium ophioglossoides CBS 100239]